MIEDYPEYEATPDVEYPVVDPQQYDHVGDELHEEPADNIMRVYVQNLNGLSWNPDGGRWPHICASMSGMQVDVACFSETNTNTNQYTVRKKMESIAKQHFTHTRLVMSASPHSTDRAYKPGGTAIMTCNSITSHIKTHTRDRMGRWTSISLSLSSTKTLRIISAYQVCNAPKAGVTTAAAQQQAQIIWEQRHTNSTHCPTPRQAFISDLQSFIRQLQEANEEIVLVGDFNDDITNPTSGMATIATTCNLVDLFALRLGSATIPSTYHRGTKRLDYVLISPTLLPHLQSAGYDPFNYRIPSDHRGMFLDFTLDSLFQHTPISLAAPQRRDFSSKTPGVVNKYVTAKMKYLNDHQFFERLRNLQSQEVLNSELAEALDRDFQRASRHAARKCTRKPRVPWSPELAFAWATLHFYRVARSAVQTHVNHTPALTKLQRQWPMLPREIPTDPQTINERYKEAIQQLKTIKAQAQLKREEFLAQQSAKYDVLDQKEKARILQRILRSETQKQIYQKIRYLRQQENGTMGLCQLKIPKGIPITDNQTMKELPDTPDFWETVTVPQTIEDLLLRRNQHHFGQARDTPFAQPPLRVDVGYKADGFAADMFLSGEVYPKTVTPAAQMLIQHLQARSTEALDGTITTKQILHKLKTWREETTTSPSGLHLGHYHCLWRRPTTCDDQQEYERIISWQKQLVQALAALINYAIRFRYTYQRWSKVINVMLQKDPGNPRVHRLRVIHIYEADYNMLLAIKWRQALHHAEDHNLLNNGMYGSRPGRSAHEPVLLEVLQNEIYRMSMKAGVNFDLDAASCYDRILPNVASLCSRRMGMNSSVVFVNALTLEEARYHLKTNMGISKAHYTHCLDNPIYGTGQGSGNSPTIWCFVCSLLFDAFASKAHGSTFSCYYRHYRTRMFMIGFVDDCSQRVNKFDQATQPPSTTLVSLMQNDAQLWNDILGASGGALEHTKCSFHLIYSHWNEDGHPFLAGGTCPHPLTLTDGDVSTTITSKSNYKSHKTLGCYVNPAHSNHATWKATKVKNELLASLLDTNYFNRWEAQVFYTSVYLPSITYPLPMTPLSLQQCEELNARIFRSILPRLGYNRHMATAIRYAPRHIGGVGVKHLYHEQGSLLLQQVYKHLNFPSTTVGTMLRIAISWTQAFLGTSRLFLTDPHAPIPPIGPSILLDLQKYLQHINAQLLIHDFPKPFILRQNDRYLMDIAIGQQKWSSRQLRQINACRRYLQSHSIADISNTEGSRLLTHVPTGSPLPDLSHLRVSIFNQTRPGPDAWKTWRRFLLTFSTEKRYLYTRLGSWLVGHNKTRYRSTFVWDPVTKNLYSHHRDEMYRTHIKVGRNDYVLEPTSTLTRANGYPASVILCNGRLRPNCSYHVAPPPPTEFIRTCNTFLPQWSAELLRDTQLLVPLSSILQHIRDSNIITCSDGSAAPDRTTFGFIISSKQGQRLLKGRGPVPGYYGNSFRSEAYGVLATLVWLHQVTLRIPKTHRYSAAITHYLDNKSVISRIGYMRDPGVKGPNSALLAEQDVIQEIVSTLEALPMVIEFEWVRGHQDGANPFHQLPLPAQLNCEADTAAATYNYQVEHSTQRISRLPHFPCQLIIQNKGITRKLKSRSIEAAAMPTYHKYLVTKFKWTQQQLDVLDWAMMSMILRKYYHQWPTVVKHLHDISPTGKVAHRNDPSLPATCPSCPQEIEDNAHVLLCPFRSRVLWRQETLSRIQKFDNPSSDPVLIDILQDGIRRYFSSSVPMDDRLYPERYSQLIQTQNKLGWDQLFKARWSIHWRILQDSHCKNSSQIAVPLAGEKWVLQIGRLLINQWMKVWEMRNIERHGRDKEQQERIHRQIIINELTAIYALKDKVCPSDRLLFHANVQEHLAQHTSISQIEDWITIYRDAIKASVQTAQRHGLHRHRAIHEYPSFNPAIQLDQQASLTAGLPTS